MRPRATGWNDELDQTFSKHACLAQQCEDGSSVSFGMYTVYRSALTYQTTQQDVELKPTFKKKVSGCSLAPRRRTPRRRSRAKRRRPDCARAMYSCELNLVHGNAALREEYIFLIANT